MDTRFWQPRFPLRRIALTVALVLLFCTAVAPILYGAVHQEQTAGLTSAHPVGRDDPASLHQPSTEDVDSHCHVRYRPEAQRLEIAATGPLHTELFPYEVEIPSPMVRGAPSCPPIRSPETGSGVGRLPRPMMLTNGRTVPNFFRTAP